MDRVQAGGLMLKGEGAPILARPSLRGEHFLDRSLQSFIRRRLREEAVPPWHQLPGSEA